MAEDIVVRYRAEVDEALKKIQAFADANTKVEKSTDKAGKSIDKTAKSVDNLGKETQATAKQIKDSSKSIDDFGKKGDGAFKGLATSAKSFALGAGAALAAAFSVDAIVQFGKASITAFLDAEKNAERLRFAITSIGGESEAAFDRLIKQSEELQKITVFDDDSIQQAQAALSAFGLTANEIERTIPLLADFATVTGVDIAQAAQQLGAGLEGAGREFKKYGIEVSATATRQQNLNAILGGFGTFAGSAEAATKTLTGQLQQQANAVGDLQESIGEKLAPAFVKAKKAIFEFVQALLLIPADEARKSTENQRQQLQRQNIDFAIATTQRIQNLDKIAAAQQLLADKEKQLDDLRLLRVNNLDAQNQRKDDIKILQEIIELEEKRLQSESAASALALANSERTLTADRLRLKSTKELNQLLADNKTINDEIAQTNIKLINDEIELRKKASDVRRKQIADELASFERLKAELSSGLDDLEKELSEKLSGLKPDEITKLRFEIEFITATQGEDVAFTQVRDDLFAQFQAEALAIDAVANNTEEANLRKKISYENYINTLKDLFPELFKAEEEAAKQSTEVVEEAVKVSLSQILNETSNLVSQVTGIYNDLTNARLEQINRVKEAEFESLDAQLEANKDALDRRQISEQDFANNQKRLLIQKQQAEANAEKKERELKRKQAQINKAAALVDIAINTAIAISSAIGPQGVVLIPLYAALGAAQAAVVAAQPIPYAKGTKKAKKGLARVGEEGEEIMYVPGGTKVLPNKQTNRYSEVLDAMFDNRFDQLYIKRKDIAPQLIKQKQIKEVNTQKSFAENIAQSAMINPATGLTYFDMEAIRKKGQYIKNVDELAKAIAKEMPKFNPYRQ